MVDVANFTVGWRRPAFNADTGFSLNGQAFKFRGFSHHASFGGLGSAMSPRVDLFRVQTTRGIGGMDYSPSSVRYAGISLDITGNFWRMSHNPYVPALYDLLDATGKCTTI